MKKNAIGVDQIKWFLVADTKLTKTGDVKIYLRFYEAGKKTDYFTGVKWPPALFDKTSQRLLKRHKDDIDCQANNLKLTQMKTIAHQVEIDAFLNNKKITVPVFIHALNKKTPYADFVNFAAKEINSLYNKSVITNATWRRHRSALNKFVEFWGQSQIPIDHITPRKIAEFDAYHRRKGKAPNTIAGYHKEIRKYLYIAEDMKLIKENPYRKFKFSFVAGDREALTQEELKHLTALFEQSAIGGLEHEVLRRFLFSCFTGLRISDTHRVTSEMIQGHVLKIKPNKTRRIGKIVEIPLPAAAMKLIADRKGPLFVPFSDQYINRALKVIAAHAQIKKRLTYHCARDTFGTIFIELGGDIKSCADLMGHSSTKTTAIYLKMSDQRKKNLMNNFDKMFG